MTTYVVGDIQGCLSCLERLLDKVSFRSSRDRLWAVGDLVNRGQQSLETLRFCKGLGSSFSTVLGNHDLHLLAVANGAKTPSAKDTFSEILNAADRRDLMNWLQQQPLLLRTEHHAIVHAGIPPMWTLEDAASRAREVEAVLASPVTSKTFFNSMYGNEPKVWEDNLEGNDRLRVITNYLTRMRYCDTNGTLELHNKMPPSKGPAGFLPWFAHSHRKTRHDKIVFGHWASLNGVASGNNLFALDTGCVWGGRLRLMSLETEKYTHYNCGK